MTLSRLYGKVIIEGKLELLTGLHIGTSNDFAPIGAVDLTVVRDPMSREPIIPGSSLKGKLRHLMARTATETGMLPDFKEEPMTSKRLFGTAGSNGEGIISSRLQFRDLRINEECLSKLKKLDLDLPYSEIKFENTLNRLTAVANPRQIERVPAGTVFDFVLTYNLEDEAEAEEDVKNIRMLLGLLEDDYLGGHGTRGYGRVRFEGLSCRLNTYSDTSIEETDIQEWLKG